MELLWVGHKHYPIEGCSPPRVHKTDFKQLILNFLSRTLIKEKGRYMKSVSKDYE